MKYDFDGVPRDSQYTIDGLYYKIGVHDHVFIFICGHWVKSAKTKADLHRIQRKLVVTEEQRVRNVKYMANRYKQNQPLIEERKRIKRKQQREKEVIQRKSKSKLRGR
jgi:hypothetical protein